MTTPALGGGNALYIISRGATHLESGEIKVNNLIIKVKKFWNVKD